eukprot:CAMPEP_0202893386 /NCGR_PEP_ID=MMETSP1392-20130828/2983_1 /ASSEMBLY_ACC=CAM_ASM_000868 /TAXON_ID=225041 /ORGANISM="Chlamydomonas chlamydogama, Strain SAG 11-48b" /LENGTH=100 /DNA_ID=CAMNT_0049577699 /DNA_START=172 /DNA_END=474 /DNA_ORIENTATION=-
MTSGLGLGTEPGEAQPGSAANTIAANTIAANTQNTGEVSAVPAHAAGGAMTTDPVWMQLSASYPKGGRPCQSTAEAGDGPTSLADNPFKAHSLYCADVSV